MNGDLISREALKKDFEERNKACDKWIAKAKDEETKIRAEATKNFICEVIMTIDNAPTALFPLTIQIIDKVTDENIEEIKQLMKAYKPQILNLEGERPHGKWIFEDEGKGLMAVCSECKAITLSTHGNFCPNCGADMRGGTE